MSGLYGGGFLAEREHVHLELRVAALRPLDVPRRDLRHVLHRVVLNHARMAEEVDRYSGT
jgi:hypothetical protein